MSIKYEYNISLAEQLLTKKHNQLLDNVVKSNDYLPIWKRAKLF